MHLPWCGTKFRLFSMSSWRWMGEPRCVHVIWSFITCSWVLFWKNTISNLSIIHERVVERLWCNSLNSVAVDVRKCRRKNHYSKKKTDIDMGTTGQQVKGRWFKKILFFVSHFELIHVRSDIRFLTNDIFEHIFNTFNVCRINDFG